MDSHTLLLPLEATQPRSTSHTSLRVRLSSKVLGIQSRPGPRHFSIDSPAGESFVVCSDLPTGWFCVKTARVGLAEVPPLTLEL